MASRSVIRGIEARAFKDNIRVLADQTTDFAVTFGATGQLRGDAMKLLENPAFGTDIFIRRHWLHLPYTDPNK